MQRAIAGYNILMLLSSVDGTFNTKEDLVIKEWLEQEFPFSKNLEHEVSVLSQLKKEDYATFLQNQADTFYEYSNQAERNNLLQFAMNLIKADGKIVKGEHQYFNQLFESWNEGE